MNLTYCNATAEDADVSSEQPLAIGLTFHHFALILGAIFTLISVVLSVFLMFMHATHYAEPLEQRYIIRIVFMVPVYAVVSLLSLRFYQHSVYFEVIRDCYEAFAIASFFSLMCHYVAPDLHEQKNYFRTITPLPWIWPAKWGKWSMFRTPRSGLTWFNVVWFCIFQYCVVRVACTILAVVTQYFDRYCIASDSPYFAHIWVTVIEAVAVTIAMFCLIQFYVQLKGKLAPYSPFWKLLAIKLVIFLCFWQTFILSFLTSPSLNVIKPGSHVAQPDLIVGIPALCVCGEMAIFAVMHVFVYPWRPYDINSPISMQLESATGAKRDRYYGGFLGLKAYLDAFNPLDIFRAVGRGFRWMFVGRKNRTQDISYQKNGATDGGPFGEGTTLGPLSSLKQNSKYQKIGEGEDQDVLLQSQAPGSSYQPSPVFGAQDRQYSAPRYPPQASNPYEMPSPQRVNPDIQRPASPYEAYRSQRKSRSGTMTSQSGISSPRPAADAFEPIPAVPTTTGRSHAQLAFPSDSRQGPSMNQDTSYHRDDETHIPWR